MANTKRSIQDIRSSQTLTPYEVYRLWQDAVESIDATRAAQLKPQMAYNYDRNGLIVKGYNLATRGGEAGRYTVEQADAFIAKWIKKNYNRDYKAAPVIDPFSDVTDENMVDGLIPQI